MIESKSPWGGPSATIKTHHNVGGLPKQMRVKLIEPLMELFKDEFPDNYRNAMDLVFKGHDPRIDADFWDERSKLEDGFEAVYNILQGLYIGKK